MVFPFQPGSRRFWVPSMSRSIQIRVVADERVGSGTGLSIRLTMTEGNELVAQLDVLSLAPHSQVTRVYDVPGTKLTIFADALGGSGSDGMDPLVYGS